MGLGVLEPASSESVPGLLQPLIHLIDTAELTVL